MRRYDAQFWRCSSCGFVFVQDPHWLEHAYADAIHDADLGVPWRAVTHSRATKALIEVFLRRSNRYLDYGAGNGLFVRHMRDLGYDFVGYEPHGDMTFARDFRVEDWDSRRFDLICAFEIAEHLEEPADTFERLFTRTDAVLFSTQLLPKSTPPPGQWWYYGLEHGQHVSFQTRRSLRALADRLGCHVVSRGSNLHLLTRRRIRRRLFDLVVSERIGKLVDLVYSRPSLLASDYEQVCKRLTTG